MVSRFLIFACTLSCACIPLLAAAETIAHYRFEDGQNGVPVIDVIDSGPNLLDGVVFGTLTYSNTVAPAQAGELLSLNATADFDYAEVPHDPVFETTNVTAEVLALPRYDEFEGGGNRAHFLLSKNWTTESGRFLSSYSLGYDPELNRFSAFVGYGDGTGHMLVSSALYGDGQWHHVALTYQADQDRSVLMLYVNATVEGCVIGPPRDLFFADEPLTIGAANFIAPDDVFRRNFLGHLDDIRISDEALVPNTMLLRDRVFGDDFEDSFSGCAVVE